MAGRIANSITDDGEHTVGSLRNWKTFRPRSPCIVGELRIGSSQGTPKYLLADSIVAQRQRQPRSSRLRPKPRLRSGESSASHVSIDLVRTITECTTNRFSDLPPAREILPLHLKK